MCNGVTSQLFQGEALQFKLMTVCRRVRDQESPEFSKMMECATNIQQLGGLGQVTFVTSPNSGSQFILLDHGGDSTHII